MPWISAAGGEAAGGEARSSPGKFYLSLKRHKLSHTRYTRKEHEAGQDTHGPTLLTNVTQGSRGTSLDQYPAPPSPRHHTPLTRKHTGPGVEAALAEASDLGPSDPG